LTASALHYNKKSFSRKKKQDSIPLAVSWLVDKVEKSHDDEEGESSAFAFALHGPEGISILYAKNETEKNDWVKDIRSAMQKLIKSPGSDQGRPNISLTAFFFCVCVCDQ